MIYYYILDHTYAKDHMDFCRIVGSNRRKEEVKEILTAIQFWWEEHVDEHSDPELDDVLEVLHEYFGFTLLDKDDYFNIIHYMLAEERENGIFSHTIDGDTYQYINLYSAREHFCGPGKSEMLWDKWLTTDEVKAAVEKIPHEQ